MVNVKIDEKSLIDMLVKRVEYWTDDDDTIKLYEIYYTDLVEGGCFEGSELDIYQIVDNDYINNLSVITKDEFYDYGLEIDGEESDRVVAKFKDVYLVSYC